MWWLYQSNPCWYSHLQLIGNCRSSSTLFLEIAKSQSLFSFCCSDTEWIRYSLSSLFSSCFVVFSLGFSLHLFLSSTLICYVALSAGFLTGIHLFSLFLLLIDHCYVYYRFIRLLFLGLCCLNRPKLMKILNLYFF